MASRLENIPPYTTVNISDAIVVHNKAQIPIFWSNDNFVKSGEGNRMSVGGTISLDTSGVYVRNDTCFEDVNVWIETVRP